MTALAASSIVGADVLRRASAIRLGASAIALGAAGVVATSLFYKASPLAAAMPVVPLDLVAAARGAVQGVRTMHAAGLSGIFGDTMISVGALVLGQASLMRGQSVAASGWILIALSTILFSVVDAMVGFVLPTVAASGASSGFLAAKSLFDILFMLGTATFGLGAVLAVARDIASSDRSIPRLLALLACAAGAVALAGGVGGILGFNAVNMMGVGILGGSTMFAIIGLIRTASAR